MNYKKLIKNQKIRYQLLSLLSWIPDALMVRLQYWIKMGFWPDFDHPSRYTEKIQIYKIKYRNPLMHRCVDKFEVRKYVDSKGLGYILNDLYGIYGFVDDVDFKLLPDQFVIKSTLGGGGQNVVVVKDKKNCDLEKIKKVLSSWLDVRNVGAIYGREWAYYKMKPRLIVEKFLDEVNGLVDYKFFCFNGDPKYLYVLTDRKMGESVKLGIYDVNFNKLNVYRCDEFRDENTLEKPLNFESMLIVARKLSSGFPHVRVDLYNIKGKIYFGELTFYDGSGYFHYDPDEFDYQAGQYFTEYN